MEDGKSRICCQTIYCDYCYTIETKCPTCKTASVVDEAQFKGKFSREGEECRICLAQGFKRGCCGEFYCNACYYNTGYCPSCRQSVKNQPLAAGSGLLTHNPGIPPVLVGYCMSVLAVLTLGALLAFIVANEQQIPETVYGFRCYGIFQECSAEQRCLELNGTAAGGLRDLAWARDCSNASAAKLRGTTCVYDPQLYAKSEGAAGFDFCRDEFNDGAYVMEDTFDYWKNETDFRSNIEASALWADMTNNYADSECGSTSGGKSLHFKGSLVRRAETADLDVRHGGHVAFNLKMGPQVAGDTVCNPAYNGEVGLYYSLDQGGTWHQLKAYEPGVYALSSFTAVYQEIPANASSNATRFKWEQKGFESARDHWALDDVQIHHAFEAGYRSTGWYAAAAAASAAGVEALQCCYKTEQCETLLARRDKGMCDRDLPGIDTTDYPIRGPELYIVFAGACALFRLVYNRVQLFILNGVETLIPSFLQKKTASIFHADDAPGDAASKHFRCYTTKEWRRKFLLLTAGPFLICWFWSAAMMENYYLVDDSPTEDYTPFFRVHVSAVLLLATYLDARELYHVARRVVCVLDRWLPVLEIDARLNNSWLRVGRDHIPLQKIRLLDKTSFEQNRRAGWAYVAGAFPWALFSLVLRFNYIPFVVARWSSKLIGAVLCCRAYYGPELFQKVHALVVWCFAWSLDDRDVVGIAVEHPRTKLLTIHMGAGGAVISAVVLGILDWGLVGFGLFWLCLYLALFYGALVGCTHGLPVIPKYFVTAMDPDVNGLFIVYDREILCPCKYGGKMMREMNAKREVLLIMMEDDALFTEMLRG